MLGRSMRLICVGCHTIRLDAIDYILEHPGTTPGKAGDAMDPARGTALTLFLKGREKGIELTDVESEALRLVLGRVCAISDLGVPTMADTAPPERVEEVAWYLAVNPWCSYDQNALIRPRLAAIRRFYPRSRIMVQPSEMGQSTIDRWRAATADLDIDWLTPRPVSTEGFGITAIAAMLDAYLDAPCPAEFLFKVDFDARVWRRFRWLPYDCLGVFGTLEFVASSGLPIGDFPNVQGGCYGMSRETARHILQVEDRLATELRDNPGIWVNGVEDWCDYPEHGRTLEDGLLRWITKRMRLCPFVYEEIDSHFRQRSPGALKDRAVTHPHKSLEPDEIVATG